MPDKLIRVGAIGAGDIVHYHLAGLQAAGGCVFHAISGRGETRARRVADQYGITNVETDYRNLLKRDDVDAVVISTPETMHEEHAVAAAQAGKHILLQKPFATSIGACERILAATEAAKVDLQVSFMHRHFEETIKVREMLQAGMFGAVHSARIRNATPGPERAWYYNPTHAGGGAVWALGVHGIDLVQHLLGSVETVAAQSDTMLKERTMPDGDFVPHITLEDQVFATYRLKSGAMVSHEISTCELYGTDRFHMMIYCENGVLELRGPRGRLAIYAPEVTGEDGWHIPNMPDSQFGERHHRHWLDIVSGDRASDPSGWDALAGMHVVNAIHAASESGTNVPVDHIDRAAYEI